MVYDYRMKKPLISVIMPVYNTPCEYLVEAVQSVLNQTYKNFELIIIDDGSDTKTKAVLKSFNDRRIVILTNEKNMGLVYTRNRGLEVAMGEYIACMDSDDISLPARFKKQIEFLENNLDVGVLGTSFSIFQKREEDNFPPTDDESIRKSLISGVSPIANPTVMMRASAIQGVKYNNDYPFAEDLAFWIELMDKTKFANLPEILLKYRWFGGNVSKKHTVQASLDTQKIMFLNFQKFCGKNTSKQLEILEKIKAKKTISGAEYKLLFEFSDIAELNRQFVRTARVCCSNLFVKIGLIS